LPRRLFHAIPPKSAPVLRLPSTVGPEPRPMPLNPPPPPNLLPAGRRRSALRGAAAGGYGSCPCGAASERAKEDDGERAGALPLGEHVPGFPGRDLPGDRASIPAHRRQPGGTPALAEVDRGQGCGRASPDAGRLPEGPPALRRERRSRARAAPALL